MNVVEFANLVQNLQDLLRWETENAAVGKKDQSSAAMAPDIVLKEYCTAATTADRDMACAGSDSGLNNPQWPAVGKSSSHAAEGFPGGALAAGC